MTCSPGIMNSAEVAFRSELATGSRGVVKATGPGPEYWYQVAFIGALAPVVLEPHGPQELFVNGRSQCGSRIPFEMLRNIYMAKDLMRIS